jgi:hypothetical protein
LIGLLLAVSVAASACGIQAKPVVEDARVLRIIVTPAPQGGLDPASGTGLAHLSRVAGVRLVYLRAMSSGSHLLVSGVEMGPSASAGILQRLAADPAIAHVEEDQRVTHQSPSAHPQ